MTVGRETGEQEMFICIVNGDAQRGAGVPGGGIQGRGGQPEAGEDATTWKG